MQEFANPREAKIYLIDRIVHEAERKGMVLSETERKTLYFSNSGWSPHDHDEVTEAFARECDQFEYERRMSALISSTSDSARKESPAAYAAWKQAVAVLGREDHYLSVLIQIAIGTLPPSYGDDEEVSGKHAVRLILTGIVVAVCVFLVTMWLLRPA